LPARTVTKVGGAALSPGDIAGNLHELLLRYNLANTRWELLTPALGGSVLRGYLSGLTLSNDVGTPNSVIDIAVGMAADSTNATLINLTSAFTKSTAGSWVAGSGGNGMGVGLTVAISTWYHVFLIVNAGAVDIYFDTSTTAANKPAGTTAFRRLGAFVTDGSAHIFPHKQVGDTFLLVTPSVDVNAVSVSDVLQTPTLTVPLGMQLEVLFDLRFAPNTAGFTILTSSPDDSTANGIGTHTTLIAQVSGVVIMAPGQRLRTNTLSQINVIATHLAGSYSIITTGWVDTRGRLS
jgi:hypothetical protein